MRINHLAKGLRKLVRADDAATAIEYGLIAALIAVAAISSMNGLESSIKTTFNTTSSSMSSANATAAA